MSFFIVASVQDSLQALNRVVSLLRGRHFQITSIASARSERPNVARLSIVVDESQPRPQRVASSLDKLEEAWNVSTVDAADVVCRAVALVKLDESIVPPEALNATLESGAGHLVDRTGDTVILELFGTPQELDRIIASFPPAGMIEIARPGELIMSRGAGPTSDATPPCSRGVLRTCA
jgi:acetolactate synthase I/III small subunit